MLIGICDDNANDIAQIRNLCSQYENDRQMQFQYVTFSTGKEVIAYCENVNHQRIDLLFLDVEMPEMDGIELKYRLLKKSMIYRIAFVTSHTENVYQAFSLKTIGFLTKPPKVEQINQMIQTVIEEQRENMLLEYIGHKGEVISVACEDILYFEANESYTNIVIYNQEKIACTLIAKKLGQIEKNLQNEGFIRVHKSYLVNLCNVDKIGDVIEFRGCNQTVPIGRKYSQQVKKMYLLYGKERIHKRLC